jgi:hypothetical protein
MTKTSSHNPLVVPRLSALLLGLLMVHITPSFAQQEPERFWLAGRYDGDRVVVYFDAVKFEATMAANARKITPPVVDSFFKPVELPASYVARFQKAPNSEHFALGDRYDLLLENGMVTTIKLTTLVGCETDEPVGNDSYIGALGTIEQEDALLLSRLYNVVRRHDQHRSADTTKPPVPPRSEKFAVLLEEPISFDMETQMAELLRLRMKKEATEAERSRAANLSLGLKVQPFQLADGSVRYYVRAEWSSGKETVEAPSYLLGAWMTPLPTLHILAIEKRTSPYGGIDDGLPALLNVIDLGNGKTGMILSIRGEDSSELDLKDYQDGSSARKMRALQSIAAGE